MPRARKTGRSIVVGGKKYRYKIGRGTTVIRRADNTVLVKVDNHVLMGVTPDTFERGQWKRTSDGMVTPRHVASCIQAQQSGTFVGALP